jgi:D-lyxose ketol-isomerase
MVVQENQLTPMHFHWHKTEDIIVRGGGDLVVELFRSDEDEAPTKEPVTVSTDGVLRTVAAGEPLVLEAGESVTLTPGVYHRFYGRPGTGTVLVGEVSTVNDDTTDNRFWEDVGRFPKIDEDEPAYRLLVTDYDIVGSAVG